MSAINDRGIKASVWIWTSVFVLIALLLLGGGYGYYHAEAERIRQEKYHDIAAISALKVEQIQQWQQERLADAHRMAGSPFFRRALETWRQNPATHDLQTDWETRLQLEQESHGYANVLLLDPEGGRLLAAQKAIRTALAGSDSVLSDFYRAADDRVYIDTVTPIISADGQPLAMLILRSFAESNLYPLIQSWPTPNHSAETLLVRREGEHIVFLNEARLRSLANILQYPIDSIQDFLDHALHEAIRLTGSKIGYIYRYHEDRQEFVLNSWSRGVMEECSIVSPQTCYELDKTGLWGEAVRQRRSILVNDFAAAHPLKKGYPAGHAPLLKYLTVPVFSGGKIVAVIGVANKVTDYHETDILQLTLLMESVWKVVERRSAEAKERQAVHQQDVLEAQLQQSQKMEAVGRLAGGVAHDFNNMLAVITGHADLALEQVTPDSALAADLQEIRSAAQRSADLTRQLLAFARKQTIAPRVLDLNDTIAGMFKMLRRLIGENIDLLWKPARDPMRVKMDPAQIDQILANLVVNARDAISGIGTIVIETGLATFDDAYCEAHAECSPGSYVLMAVSNNGIGMDHVVLSRLFDPFFTTKPPGQGTGLGLATVYGIVKQNNGFIYVYSEPGKGATFKIYLPRHTADLVDAQAALIPAVTPMGTETVLLVEDEAALLKLNMRMLQQLGYTVLAAGSPDQALQQVEAHDAPIHLLLTDVVMPGMSGRELWQRLSALRPDMRCVFMSGYTANVIAHHGVLDEGVHFLQKPFSREALAREIRQALSVNGGTSERVG